MSAESLGKSPLDLEALAEAKKEEEAAKHDAYVRMQPILFIDGQASALYSYRLDDGGIYFVQLNDDLSGSDQVNYTNRFVLLNSAGKTFRDPYVKNLLKNNVERLAFGE
jgi:hypothetical protein